VDDRGDFLRIIKDLGKDEPNVDRIVGRTGARYLYHPSGACFHPDGRLFVADTGNNRILAFDRQGRLLQLLKLPDFVERPSGLTLRTSSDGNHSWLSVCFYGRGDRNGQPGVAVFEVKPAEFDVIELDD
jgi:sugar lactone lactonase YvrE